MFEPMLDSKTVGNVIAEFRKRKGVSQEVLSGLRTLGQLGGDISDIDRLVSQAFKLRGQFVVLVQDRSVVFVLQVRKQFDQVPAQVVCQPVHLHLLRGDLFLPLRAELLQLFLRPYEVLPGDPEHGLQHVVAAAHRKRRRGKEYGTQGFDQFAVGIRFLLLFPDDPVAQFLVSPEHGEKADRAGQVEDCIGIGNDARIHCPLRRPRHLDVDIPLDLRVLQRRLRYNGQ